MVVYTQKDSHLFCNFAPRVIGYDVLTRIIASLEDYPYTGVFEYVEINSPSFLSLFTTDGEVGVIKTPTTSLYGETKYVITRCHLPRSGYLIVASVSSDGNITCKIQNEVMNPNCRNMLFSIHVAIEPSLRVYNVQNAFQKYRDYNVKPMFENIVSLYNEESLNLKRFMELRHDLIQVYIAKSFGLSLHLGTDLDLSIYGVFTKQTPDFFEINDNEVLLGDLTITSDPTSGYLGKATKYNNLIEQFMHKGFKVIPFFLSFDHYFRNFHSTIREAPIPTIQEDHEFYSIFGELASMFDVLKNTYPHEDTESLNIRYPIVRNKIGENYEYIKGSVKKVDEMELLSTRFKDNVLEKFADKEFDSTTMSQILLDLTHESLHFVQAIKPSHYIPIPPDDAGMETIRGKNSEQQMILNFLSRSVKDEVYNAFSSGLSNCMTKYPQTSQLMFFDGKWCENEAELKEEYHEKRILTSFEDYLRTKEISIPKPGEDKVPYPKMIHLGKATSTPVEPFLDKSGQDYRKKHDRRTKKPKTSCDVDKAYENVELFLDMLCQDTGRSWSEDFFSELGSDERSVMKIKENYSKMAKADIGKISNSYAMKYLRYNSLMYEQLIHYSNLSMSKKRYAMFNSGIPNILGCMRCGYRGMAQQIGKPFFFMGFTKNPEFLDTNMFGGMYIEEVSQGLYYFRTGWFRLPTFRIEFFRDQYYSILSSSLCSYSRLRNMGMSKKMLKGVFALRTLVGLVANQKFMEKLADSRYAIMSSFATHTNFDELIREKFSPPYKSSVEGWLVKRLLTQLPRFRDEVYDTNNIRINTPILDYLDRRFQQSTGGRFKVKAVWSDRKLHSLQDLLDELFLYVHTPKEPSTAFHEEVNAVKTIKKFEDEFNKYTFKEKCGEHSDIVDWLMSGKTVGFDKEFLYTAAVYYKSVVDFDLNKIEKIITKENIGELTSTKSVIPDKERTIKPMDKHAKYRINSHILQHGTAEGFPTEYIKEHEKKLKKKVNRSTAEVYHGRHKVHDEIITYLEHYHEPTVISNAIMYYNDPLSDVLTDICIKAQYGAKREFYVMNMGSKIMARVVENFYKEIAKRSDNEMISVPGDRKLIHMQNMMDRTIKHALKNGNIVSYCNGDCTKWSASETMEAFHVLTEGLCEGWDSDLKFVIQAIINRWSKKHIQIPLNIVSKVYPLGTQTDYLKEAAENNYKIPSTQNFLQGVFNYMSSVKADVCNRYTCYLWNKYYNYSNDFFVEYLVHSDDYVFAFSSPTVKRIEEFRKFHKVCMRLCGITDSSKKTNVQPIFMEFISLVCFNGAMAYPTIKKTKEVATTLPCESFSGDSNMVCSRTGECVRVGLDYYSAWIFHRIHMSLLRRAYSLHKGGENYFEDSCNVPVQVFGQSDMHPIFYFLCKGDPNNLRIFNYTHNKDVLLKLYTMSNYSDKLKTIHSSFREPSFIYNNYTKRISTIREETGISMDEAMKYWEENIVYNFVKPRQTDDLLGWLKAMYFKSSFIKAYNRDSRTTRMLRLSSFSKGKCVTFKTDDELQQFYFKLSQAKDKRDRTKLINSEMLTIKELMKQAYSFPIEVTDDRDVQIAIMMGDSTGDLIYRWLSEATIHGTNKVNTFNTCATFSPFKATWLNVSQPVDQVLCYAADEHLFIKNFGDACNLSAIKSDLMKLEQALPGIVEIIRSAQDYPTRVKAFQIAYNTYTNNLAKFQVCMSSKRHRQNIVDFLVDGFKFCHDPVYISDVVSKVVQMEINPYTLKRSTILGTAHTTSPLRLICNNLSIAYTYLLTQRKLPIPEIAEIIKNTMINDLDVFSTCQALFENYDYDKAKLEGLTYVELLMFVFFKKLITDDNESILRVCRNRQYYNYTYINPQTYNPETRKYEGDMLAHVHFEKTYSLVKIKANKLSVELDANNSFKAEIAYYIALKLSSLISEREFNKLLVRSNLTKYSSRITAQSKGFYLTCVSDKPVMKYCDAGEVFFGVNCKFNPKLVLPKLSDKAELYMLNTDFRIVNASVSVGQRKLFTLPYKSAYYSDIQMHTDFKDICLYNDLMAFHILGVAPRHDHDLIQMLKDWAELHPYVEPAREAVSLEIGDLELVIPDDFPSLDLDLNLFEGQENMIELIDDEDLLEFYEEPELAATATQSVFAPMLSNIELVDPTETVMPSAGSLKHLENKGDLFKRTLLKLLGISEKIFLRPFECACVIRTVRKMLSDTNHPWVKPLAQLLGEWLEKTVKVVPKYQEREGYLIGIEDDSIVFYRKRSRAASTCRRLGLATGGDYLVLEDFSETPDSELVHYYVRVSDYEFWQNVGGYKALPFYTKRDDFFEFIQSYSIESDTL